MRARGAPSCPSGVRVPVSGSMAPHSARSSATPFSRSRPLRNMYGTAIWSRSGSRRSASSTSAAKCGSCSPGVVASTSRAAVADDRGTATAGIVGLGTQHRRHAVPPLVERVVGGRGGARLLVSDGDEVGALGGGPGPVQRGHVRGADHPTGVGEPGGRAGRGDVGAAQHRLRGDRPAGVHERGDGAGPGEQQAVVRCLGDGVCEGHRCSPAIAR